MQVRLLVPFMILVCAVAFALGLNLPAEAQPNYTLYEGHRPDPTLQGPGYTKIPEMCLFVDYKGKKTIVCSGVVKYQIRQGTDANPNWSDRQGTVASFPLTPGTHELFHFGKADGSMRNYDHSGVVVTEK